jgi:AMMECR1 domain-containing protein
MDDFRFNPVQPDEVPAISIEISVLSQPEPLDYTGPDDLLQRLRPGIDVLLLWMEENARRSYHRYGNKFLIGRIFCHISV